MVLLNVMAAVRKIASFIMLVLFAAFLALACAAPVDVPSQVGL
jgi:hypothetical protein